MRPLLPDAGAALHVLDLAFGHGETFFQTWLSWQQGPGSAGLLHYVALASEVPDLDAVQRVQTDLFGYSTALEPIAAHWTALEPGWQRITLAQGRLRLTLCIGPPDASLRELAFEADQIWLGAPKTGANAAHSDLRLGKTLARLCHRGTELWGSRLEPTQLGALSAGGFVLADDAGHAGKPRQLGVYEPCWEIRRTRSVGSGSRGAAGHCAVVGAGLAGASTAAALAQRGWQVTVLDQNDQPAGGASGLPVGLLVPHVSADDCLLSRLSRAGLRMTLEHARRLLEEGQDWAPSGVMGLPIGDRRQSGDQPLWHDRAAWIKPAALVRAWMSRPGVQHQGGACVASLQAMQGQWSLRDDHGRELARADRVVLANGLGALPLLQALQRDHPPDLAGAWPLPRLSGMHGLVSWGFEDDTPLARFPEWPVNGAGSLACGIPVGERRAWFLGAGYHPSDQALPSSGQCHQNNLARLALLLPELALALQPAFEDERVQAWQQIRCVTPDRLPVVGPVDDRLAPGLWLYSGLGSRGLTFSVLCAELIAAQWANEPLPIRLSEARKLGLSRPSQAARPTQRSFR